MDGCAYQWFDDTGSARFLRPEYKIPPTTALIACRWTTSKEMSGGNLLFTGKANCAIVEE
jgi:hypothetical protein